MKLEIVNIVKPTEDSVSLYFRKTGALEHYKPGQHALLSFKPDKQIYRRTYSFHTSPYRDENVGITVRAVEGGFISNYLQSIKPDAEIILDGIGGEFTVEPIQDNKRHLVMFAAGTGITPIMSMLKTIMHNEPHSRVSLIYSNRTYDRIIFKDELLRLAQEFKDRLTVYHVLTQDDKPQSDFPVFYNGRLSKLITKKMLQAILAAIDYQVEYYLCGPFSFMQLVEDVVQSLSPGTTIHKEHFFIPEEGQEFDLESLLTREIIVLMETEERLLAVPGGKSILQSALENGIRLRYKCTEGQCGSCRGQLISGEVKLRRNHILTSEELSKGQILLCQSYPLTDNVIVKPVR